ncbi:hypothetical protein GCM10027169_33220 [Gordonia jinhuaensis]|uniref:High-affinity iron transporter n=1 Tax=Gordonia jinhuaensis TaxID=1517702 RepID=A0A916WT63_9ACTN|nr:iron uptake transporter permease EfeU [Gordonia jinhuaensis]GGB27377.1 hypothetical protein GCM10011489_14420 [Gordonia jinhuaensis]
MFATLVIGLREGLEAALIVGIIAAFLRKQGHQKALKWMWAGVVVAVVICVGVAIALEVISSELPQRAQEGLETVIGAIAIAMVTYMIVWMRNHSRHLKREIESAASDAMVSGSAMALAGMAFLAVLREGLETSVFLVAAFNASHNAVPATIGALLGIGIAVVLGYGIYRGGVRINLAKFFTFTGLLLVLVAAGLTMTALHTAHEAGWLNVGQQQVVDLTWLVRPGSIQESLLTGVLGIQARPVLIEVVGWVLYIVIVGALVLWPQSKPLPRRSMAVAGALVGVGALIAATAVWATAPSEPTPTPAALRLPAASAATADGILAGHTVTAPADVTVRTDDGGTTPPTMSLTAAGTTTELKNLVGPDETDLFGVSAHTWTTLASPDIDVTAFVRDAPTTVTLAQIIAGNGGRTPVGLNTQTFGESAPVVYVASATVTAALDPTFEHPMQASVNWVLTATATPRSGSAVVLGKVVRAQNIHQADAAQADAIVEDQQQLDAHHTRGFSVPLTLTVIGAVLLALAVCVWPWHRRGHRDADTTAPGGSDHIPLTEDQHTHEKKEITQ